MQKGFNKSHFERAALKSKIAKTIKSHWLGLSITLQGKNTSRHIRQRNLRKGTSIEDK
jgi:hypothetical protein